MMTPESSWNITMSSTTKPWIETAQPYYASEPPMNDLKTQVFHDQRRDDDDDD